MSEDQRDQVDPLDDAASGGDTAPVMKDPTDTDHPTGERQAKENQETESPS